MFIAVTLRLLTQVLGVEAQARTRVSKGGKQGAILKGALPLMCCSCTCLNLSEGAS